jgi:hypothetical protein
LRCTVAVAQLCRVERGRRAWRTLRLVRRTERHRIIVLEAADLGRTVVSLLALLT